MEFKGTNGWFLDKEGYLKDKNLDIIADFFITNQEDLANAKLASKAPEMLEALQFFVNNNMLSVIGEEVAERLINEILE